MFTLDVSVRLSWFS